MEGNTEQLQLALAVASSEPGRAGSTVGPSHSSVRVGTWLSSFASQLCHLLCCLRWVISLSVPTNWGFVRVKHQCK